MHANTLQFSQIYSRKCQFHLYGQKDNSFVHNEFRIFVVPHRTGFQMEAAKRVPSKTSFAQKHHFHFFAYVNSILHYFQNYSKTIVFNRRNQNTQFKVVNIRYHVNGSVLANLSKDESFDI